MGNIVPLIPSVLVGAIAVALGSGVWSVGWAVIVAIPLISRYGFWENAMIRSELLAKHPDGGVLVGFVFDRQADWLDAHAEVGLITVKRQRVMIQTEERLVEVPLNKGTTFKRKFNIHQAIGLGGWIVIENEDLPILLIESRECDTMYASKRETDALFERLTKEKGGS